MECDTFVRAQRVDVFAIEVYSPVRPGANKCVRQDHAWAWTMRAGDREYRKKRSPGADFSRHWRYSSVCRKENTSATENSAYRQLMAKTTVGTAYRLLLPRTQVGFHRSSYSAVFCPLVLPM